MLTIIIKGTNGCNLACSYCSLGEKKNFKYIEEESMKSLMIFACNLAKYRKEKKINFILHGGEPTLISPEIYDVCISFIKKKYSELDITISMQTNGLVLTDKFLQIIKKYDINVGVSIDGSEKIHNSERKMIDGKDSFTMVAGNIEKMLAENVQVSCLMVLTKNALEHDLEYLRYFAERDIHLKINPLLNYGETICHPELVLNQGDYAKYLVKIYEEIIQKNIDINVSPIDKIISGIIHDQPIRECSFDGQCNKHFLCIDYKGDIFPCGKFSDIEKMCIGNISDTTFNEIEYYLQKNICIRRNEKIPIKCKQCQYLDMCNGGCSAEAMIEGKYFDAPVLCDDYVQLFKYFRTDGLKLLREVLIKNKSFLEEQL